MMNYDALRVAVRGFGSAENGALLANKLEDFGFEVELILSAHLDSEGGMVETYITPVVKLDPEEVDEIGRCIYETARSAGIEGVLLQWEGYRQTGGGDWQSQEPAETPREKAEKLGIRLADTPKDEEE